MLKKFKVTTYATLLLIAVFGSPYVGNVTEVSAEGYGCKGSKQEVRQCLKAVISERDATIVEMQGKLDDADARLEAAGLVATSASDAEKAEETARLNAEAVQNFKTQCATGTSNGARFYLNGCYICENDPTSDEVKFLPNLGVDFCG